MTPRHANGANLSTTVRWSDLSGQRVLVTGASSGIGRATALTLAACGAAPILLARNGQALAEVRSEIEAQHGVQARTWVADLKDSAVIRNLIVSLPRLDALVNNAGHNIPQRVEDVDELSFDAVFGLNVRAAFFTAQSCVAKFREQRRGGDGGRGGAIVNVSSQMGHVGANERTVYCASKHAMEGMTKAMAVELAPEGIRVNSVCPTFISTPLTRPMFENTTFKQDTLAKIPLGRLGTVEEVAAAIVFLLSPAASLVTGASLTCDGGWTAQ